MAFILGTLHVIVKEKHYNLEFIERYCHSFDRLVEHIEDYTPAWAARETEIPEEEIAKIAREFSDAAPRAIYTQDDGHPGTMTIFRPVAPRPFSTQSWATGTSAVAWCLI